MIIEINQKKIAFGDKYKIYINGQLTHFASTELISFLPKLYLFSNQNTRARFIMEKRWSWFDVEYRITLWDGNEADFTTVSIWKSHFQYQDGGDIYDIYGHRGRKHSVYKNDIQIAWWDKEMMSWFEGDIYKIIADDDSNYELIMAFCLILDNQNSNDNNDNTITFDFGNIGPQAKKFDHSWRPKQVI